MIDLLISPFHFEYMIKAILISSLVGGVCAFLSSYLMLKGWSLIGDALSHSVVPGVAIAYVFSLPYAIGAFFSGVLAAISILIIKIIANLREDSIIGFIFTTFFALGLLIISLNPTQISVQEIIFGNILAIANDDIIQVGIIIIICIGLLFVFWKDLLLVFFDEIHASSIGINVLAYKILFFSMLSACVVAALQTVGAILVIAMVITPGATGYLLSDRFGVIASIATILGIASSAIGVYISYFFDGVTGGIIVSLQTLLFLLAFIFSPKYGLLRRYLKVQK
ncbi:MAG: metal ABC transporter permease [Helicobacter sp.]|nr:metal ABC transporter permease [Helicobacter sp.]